MQIVVNSNILISALIKDSVRRHILVNSSWEFYYPADSLQELNKYKKLILDKSGLKEEEYNVLFNGILKRINLVSYELIKDGIDKAKREISKRDPKDAIFLATAISLKFILWSDDKDFDNQNLVRVLKTKDIKNLFDLDHNNS